MSDVITLRLRAPLDARIDLEGVTADRLAALTAKEIGALTVWSGRREAQIGDFFDVTGERSARLRVEGDLSRVDGLGAGSAGGELVIDGDAGDRVGAGMTGGWIEVSGNVGDEAGLAMSAGGLVIKGRAGDRLGAAAPGASRGMSGGEIIVGGSAGAGAAARVRRGLIAVAGDAGRDAARDIIAGTLVVLGRVNGAAGLGSKRGTVVAAGGIEVPATYRYACTYEPPLVRLLLTYLRRRYGMMIDDRVVTGRYRRYCGDAGEPGKGEILEWTAE